MHRLTHANHALHHLNPLLGEWAHNSLSQFSSITATQITNHVSVTGISGNTVWSSAANRFPTVGRSQVRHDALIAYGATMPRILIGAADDLRSFLRIINEQPWNGSISSWLVRLENSHLVSLRPPTHDTIQRPRDQKQN